MNFILDLPYDFSSEFLLELGNSFECRYKMLTYLDFRDVPTLVEAKTGNWYNNWFDKGVNHREERGMVVCEHKSKHSCLIIEIQDLEELIRFQTKYKYIEISDSRYLEIPKEITIGND